MPAGYPRPYARQLNAEDLRKRSIKNKLEDEFETLRANASKTPNFPFRRRKKQAAQIVRSKSDRTPASDLLITKLLDFIEIYREVQADVKKRNSENNRYLADMGNRALSRWISKAEPTVSKNLHAISNGHFEEVTNEDALVVALRYAAQIVYMQDNEDGLTSQPKVVDLLIHKLTSAADFEEKVTSPTMLNAFEDLIFVLSDHANGHNTIAEFTLKMRTNISCAAAGRENISDSPVGLTIN